MVRGPRATRGREAPFCGDETWAPLAVLYGDVQAMPTWICALAHVSKAKNLPSGCVAWEYEGIAVSMPPCDEVFAPSRSMTVTLGVRRGLCLGGGSRRRVTFWCRA